HGRLCLQLIEVKFRSGAGSPAEEVALKEAIVIKNEDTRKVLEACFVPRAESDRLDREIQNKQLANLLQFYLDRCRRHGLIAPHLADAADIQHIIRAVTEGSNNVLDVGGICKVRGYQPVPAAAVQVELEEVCELLVLNLAVQAVRFCPRYKAGLQDLPGILVLDHNGLFERNFLGRAACPAAEFDFDQLETEAAM